MFYLSLLLPSNYSLIFGLRMEKINKPGKISEFFFASAIIEHAIVATVAIFGMRFYAKVLKILFSEIN